jgi:ATP/maltotriose-dependent transcriptional regulator MalT
VHRVAAAEHIDEALALDLDRAAGCATPPSAELPASTLFAWATDLSQDQSGRERRLLLSVLHVIYTGQTTAFSKIWPRVGECAPSPLRECVLAGRAMIDSRFSAAERHLRRVLSVPGAIRRNPDLGATALGLYSLVHCALSRGEQAIATATAAIELGTDDRCLDRMLTYSLITGHCHARGAGSALVRLAEVADLPQSPARVDPGDDVVLLARGTCRVLAGELAGGAADLSEVVRRGTVHAEVHQWLALAQYLLGAWDEAEANARTALALRDRPSAGGGPHAVSAIVAASRGDRAAAERHAALARRLADGGERPETSMLAALADATLALTREDLPAVLDALKPLADGTSTVVSAGHRALWLPLLVEALVEVGPERDAALGLEELHALAESTPYLRITAGRLDGRFAERRKDLQAAHRSYERTLADSAECEVPLLTGRLEHSFGRLLYALSDATAAESWLRRAHSRLGRLDAQPFLRRVAADLRLCRGDLPEDSAVSQPAVSQPVVSQSTVSRPAGTQSYALTERERTVAELVACGLTNQETAARLYVSSKAVEYHLTNIYNKLGISSRHQLPSALRALAR